MFITLCFSQPLCRKTLYTDWVSHLTGYSKILYKPNSEAVIAGPSRSPFPLLARYPHYRKYSEYFFLDIACSDDSWSLKCTHLLQKEPRYSWRLLYSCFQLDRTETWILRSYLTITFFWGCTSLSFLFPFVSIGLLKHESWLPAFFFFLFLSTLCDG